MRNTVARPVLLSVLLLVAPVVVPALVAQTPILEFELVADGFAQPIYVTSAEDGSDRLFVLEQGQNVGGTKTGNIRVVEDGVVLPTPFLTLSGMASAGEQGLLGLAFHPDYATNGWFYVDYSRGDGDTVIARYQVSAGDPNVADAGSESILLTISQPFTNHNGGHLAFGPDGYLYVSSGDGGSGGDPGDRAQNVDLLLGKILRLDVDGGPPYGIPPSNPFVGTAGADEIWAYGLRNPWRFSFDRATGDLFIGDVGQNTIEEIDFQPAGLAGVNWGWRCYEGSNAFNLTDCGDPEDYRFPILEYDHTLGCSVTGGFRYRGPWPSIESYYLYSDFCSGTIWGATTEDSVSWSSSELADTAFAVASFGEGDDGELFVVDRAGGAIYRVVGLLEVHSDGFESGDCGAWSATVGGC
jgi:hypothetical protein